MLFEHPHLLWLLWLLPGLAWLLIRAQRQQQHATRRFVDRPMVPRLLPPISAGRGWTKIALLLTGLALLIVAGARPRFGVYFEKVAARGIDVFVLLDVSRSMMAEDVKPSRLERAKSDLLDLLPHLAGDRIGLIVYAGRPVVKVPLTSDYGFFRGALDEVDTHSAPRGGSLLGDAIRKGVESLPREAHRGQVLLVLSDGDDQDSFPQEAAEQAAQRGIKVFAVGLGDAQEGGRIPLRDAAGNRTYLTYEGKEVWTKLDDRALKQAALATGGAYIPAGTRAYDLGQIYDAHLAGLVRGEYQSDKRKRFAEQYQCFLGLGALCLLVEMLLPAHLRPVVSLAREEGRG